MGAVQFVQPCPSIMSIAPLCHWRPETAMKFDTERLRNCVIFWIDDGI